MHKYGILNQESKNRQTQLIYGQVSKTQTSQSNQVVVTATLKTIKPESTQETANLRRGTFHNRFT